MTNVWQGQPGLWNTNSYLASGIPFVTGSTILSSSYSTNNGQMAIQFPYVTRSITIVNTSGTDIRIHFNSVADGNVINGHHYLTLTDQKDSVTLTVKCKEIYLSLTSNAANATFEVFAELTNIKRDEMFTLTGSGLTD